MAAASDVELIKRGYEAFAKADLETVGEIFADDIEWTIPGRTSLAGTRKGKSEVFDFFGQLFEQTGGTFSLEVLDLCGSDRHVVALTHETGDRDGKRLDSRNTHVWQVRDGKAVSFAAYNLDQYAVDDFYD